MSTTCERYGHAFYVGVAGSIGCGRCGLRHSTFCVVDGKPTPYCEHRHPAA